MTIAANGSKEERIFTDGTFKAFRFHVATPNKEAKHGVVSVERSTERKLQIVDRALTDGSDVHDFGRKGITYTAEIVFFGPNFQNEFYKFESLLNEGTPGKLILPDHPKAIWAMFQKMSQKATAQDGESFSVSVTWVEAASVPSSNRDKADLTSNEAQVNSVTDSAQKVANSAENTKQAISGNSILKTISESANSALNVKTTINNVIGLAESKKSNLTALSNSLSSQVDSAKGLANRVLGFVKSKSALGSTQNLVSGSVPYTIDPQTGVAITKMNSEDDIVRAPDPLHPISSTSSSLPDIQTDAAAEVELTKIINSLNTSKSSMEDLSGGRTADISLAVIDLVNNLTEMKVAIAPIKLRAYIVQVPLSLNEVLFFNDISVDRCDDIYKNNTHILDPLCISAGEVVYL